MSRSRFEKLARVIHFTDNNIATDDIEKDKLWKVTRWQEEFQSVQRPVTLECTCRINLTNGDSSYGDDQGPLASCMTLMYIREGPRRRQGRYLSSNLS